MNLCTNAYHAVQETGGKLEVSLKEIYISYEQSLDRVGMKIGKHIELTVKDSGHGMEPQVIERIFEPYFTTKKQGKGTGLGLSVIHGIVGAIVGTPVPVIGSLLGVFAGTMVGAAIATWTLVKDSDAALKAGWGALLGRAAAVALKMAAGLVILVAGAAALLF